VNNSLFDKLEREEISSHMSNLQFQFKNKNIVVTGGAQGIGYQMALQFLQSGAQVSIWDYSEQALQQAMQQLREHEGRVHFAKVDVSRMDSCTAAAASLSWQVDVLINNAGITRDKSFAKMSSAEWDAVIGTNLTGLFNVTKSLFEKFNASSMHKRIINISSVVALYGNFGQTNYVAAKAGVIGMTKTWSREFARKGFTVNAIAPGFIRTAMTEQMPAEVLQQMSSKVPVARLGMPEDIAHACMFLASEQASYINGHVFSVDGGLVL
jgi:3-oxoacyl-[acyl-carrier protein] reductase